MRLLLALIIAGAFFSVLTGSASPNRKRPPAGERQGQDITFTVPDVLSPDDLHGEIASPDLVIFASGNEFMVLPEIIRAFKEAYPRYGRIFMETLPPGILERQIRAGSLTTGSLRIDHQPDVLTGGLDRLRELDKQEDWFERIVPYARNRLAIMVRQGNPRKVESLRDLGREEIHVSMPDPEIEGIAGKIIEAMQKDGGEQLVKAVMMEKVRDGSTFITSIHHRQTPRRIADKESDAGPVWITEALHARTTGAPLEMVPIPEESNVTAASAAGSLRRAPHPKAAADFLDFLKSDKARAIFRAHGFMAP